MVSKWGAASLRVETRESCKALCVATHTTATDIVFVAYIGGFGSELGRVHPGRSIPTSAYSCKLGKEMSLPRVRRNRQIGDMPREDQQYPVRRILQEHMVCSELHLR
jgi:hypothetical protein